MTRDHMLGYTPAATPEWHDWGGGSGRWALGWPRRVMDAAMREVDERCGRGAPRVATTQCVTPGDVVGLQRIEEPLPAEPAAESLLVTIGRGCRERVNARTLSAAAEWPFGQDVSPPMTPEAIERAMREMEQRKRDAITSYCRDRVRA